MRHFKNNEKYKGQGEIEGKFVERKNLFLFFENEESIVYKRVKGNLVLVRRAQLVKYTKQIYIITEG